MIFSKNSNLPIGLDISDLSLKLAQLNKNGDKIKIQAIGKYNIPPGLIENGEIKNAGEVIKAIKELINAPKFGKVSSREVIACLPNSKTFVKLIEIEKTPNDLNNVIEEEIEKHIPMSIKDMYYDWQIIKNFPNKQQVLIGAAGKSIVDQYTELFNEAKLSLIALEIEPISLCRCLLAEEHYKHKGAFDKNYGILDIGATRTNMTIYSKNTILFTVKLPISGNEITENIAGSLKIKKGQAEKAKMICGLDGKNAQGIIKNILTDTVNKLLGKINDSLDFYAIHYPDNGPLDEIILCGGGANIKDIDKTINKSTAIKTIRGDTFANLGKTQEKLVKILTEKSEINTKSSQESDDKSQNQPITQDNSLSFATAIGLSLRQIFINEL